MCDEQLKILVFVMKLGSGFFFISWFASGSLFGLLISVVPGMLFLSVCPQWLPVVRQYNEAEALKLPDEGAFE